MLSRGTSFCRMTSGLVDTRWQSVVGTKHDGKNFHVG